MIEQNVLPKARMTPENALTDILASIHFYKEIANRNVGKQGYLLHLYGHLSLLLF